MIIDHELELSDGQAITADAASENIIDFGQTSDVAPGVPLQIRFQGDTALSGGSFSALTVEVETDTVEAFSSATQLLSFTAPNVAGDEYVVRIPEGCQQYLRLNYNVDANPTAGAVSAFVEVYQAPEGDITAIPGNL